MKCLSKNEFCNQLSEIWVSAVSKKQIKEQQVLNAKEFINKCYQLYLNAFHGKLPFIVLGNDKLCETQEERYNFGILATDKPFRPLETNARPPTEMHQGAILSQTDWCVTLNDCFVLGAIHAQKSFHLYEPTGELDDKTLWDDKHQRPRILGRELMMLQAAGYGRIDHGHKILEKVFCFPKKGRKWRLKELFNSAEKNHTLAKIRAFINDISIARRV